MSIDHTALSDDIRHAGWVLRGAQDTHVIHDQSVVEVTLERRDGLKVSGAGKSFSDAIRAAETRIRESNERRTTR